MAGTDLGVVRDVTALKTAEDSIKRSAQELRRQKAELEKKNIALSEVLSQIELEKQKLRQDVAANVEDRVLPLLGRLRAHGAPGNLVNALRRNLKDIASSFIRDISARRPMLSPREVEICDMLRGGLSSKEIAGLLNTSYKTVEKQRGNIRKKLKISGKGINLGSYLQKM